MAFSSSQYTTFCVEDTELNVILVLLSVEVKIILPTNSCLYLRGTISISTFFRQFQHTGSCHTSIFCCPQMCFVFVFLHTFE